MDDAGEERFLRILVGDPAGNDPGERGDMGAVFPELVGQGAMRRGADLLLHLAHDNGRRQRPQGRESEARNGAADIARGASGRVVGDGIGDADNFGR